MNKQNANGQIKGFCNDKRNDMNKFYYSLINIMIDQKCRKDEKPVTVFVNSENWPVPNKLEKYYSRSPKLKLQQSGLTDASIFRFLLGIAGMKEKCKENEEYQKSFEKKLVEVLEIISKKLESSELEENIKNYVEGFKCDDYHCFCVDDANEKFICPEKCSSKRCIIMCIYKSLNKVRSAYEASSKSKKEYILWLIDQLKNIDGLKKYINEDVQKYCDDLVKNITNKNAEDSVKKLCVFIKYLSLIDNADSKEIIYQYQLSQFTSKFLEEQKSTCPKLLVEVEVVRITTLMRWLATDNDINDIDNNVNEKQHIIEIEKECDGIIKNVKSMIEKISNRKISEQEKNDIYFDLTTEAMKWYYYISNVKEHISNFNEKQNIIETECKDIIRNVKSIIEKISKCKISKQEKNIYLFHLTTEAWYFLYVMSSSNLLSEKDEDEIEKSREEFLKTNHNYAENIICFLHDWRKEIYESDMSKKTCVPTDISEYQEYKEYAKEILDIVSKYCLYRFFEICGVIDKKSFEWEVSGQYIIKLINEVILLYLYGNENKSIKCYGPFEVCGADEGFCMATDLRDYCIEYNEYSSCGVQFIKMCESTICLNKQQPETFSKFQYIKNLPYPGIEDIECSEPGFEDCSDCTFHSEDCSDCTFHFEDLSGNRFRVYKCPRDLKFIKRDERIMWLSEKLPEKCPLSSKDENNKCSGPDCNKCGDIFGFGDSSSCCEVYKCLCGFKFIKVKRLDLSNGWKEHTMWLNDPDRQPKTCKFHPIISPLFSKIAKIFIKYIESFLVIFPQQDECFEDIFSQVNLGDLRESIKRKLKFYCYIFDKEYEHKTDVDRSGLGFVDSIYICDYCTGDGDKEKLIDSIEKIMESKG